MELKERASKGVSLGFINQFVTKFSQFVFGIWIARLLSPEDYGLVGMLAIFLGISETFIQSGFGVALLQKKNPTNVDYSSVFWFNLVVSLFIYGVLYLTSPLIAEFYDEPKLVVLTKVVALSIIFRAIGGVQGKYLQKNLKFERQTKAYILTVLFSSILTLALAYFDFGVWALVGRQLSLAFMLSFLWWLYSNWKPSFVFSLKSFKSLFKVGSGIFFTGILNIITKNINSVIIGRYFSTASLGYYDRAKNFVKIQDTVSRILQDVSFPVLSHIQDEDERLNRAYSQLFRLSAFIVFPVVAITIVFAKPMIVVLITEKWLPAVPFLQIMALSTLKTPFMAVNNNVLFVKGRTKFIFRMEIVKKILFVLSIIALFRYGVKGLAVAYTLESAASAFIPVIFSNKMLLYKIKDQLRDVFPIILFTLVSSLFMYLFIYFTSNDYLQFFVTPIVGFLIYTGLALLFKRSEPSELITIVRKYMLKKS